MLRRLFGGGRDDPPPRRPEHVWELRAGDFVKFALAAPEGLSGAECQVTGAFALDLGGPGKVRRVIELDVPDFGPIHLWRDERDRVALAREAGRADVERLFDLGQFGRLFDPEEPADLVLKRIGEPPGYDGWTAPVYRQEGAQQAWHHATDPDVGMVLDTVTTDANGIDFYRLVSDDRRHVLEVAVFDGGRTDVYAAVLASEGIVDEIWTA